MILVLPLLLLTYRQYPLTPLVYALIFMHSLVLIEGGIHTYARVPLGFWLQNWLNLNRNPYDKIGHFFQGLTPAIAAREILLRGRYIHGDRMRVFIILCIVLAISASYELLEWLTVILWGGGAYDFLGTQGDPWDTHSDMLCAVIGAITALVLLSGIHDRQMAQMNLSEQEADFHQLPDLSSGNGKPDQRKRSNPAQCH